ncbi:MAG: alpha/beta hydrolase [Acidimicrobiia bacterium]
MRTVALTLRLLALVVVAVIRAIGRRLRRGPAVPGWSWTVELRVVALRSFIMSTRAHPDRRARAKLEAGFDPSLPRRLRSVMRVRPEMVGGVAGEWHERTDTTLTNRCTLLYFHGGGYLAGSAATHRRWAARLTWAIGCKTYVPEYRLAPQHPFPAALDDALAVYLALLERGVRPEEIVVAGDSAGGGLSLALLLRLRDEGHPLPAGAVLFSPYTDLEHTAGSIVTNAGTDYLPLGEIRANTEYLGDHDPKDPYASPMYGDYTGIPPLLVFAGGREMILDDSTRLVDRARSRGCDVTLHVAPDMYHVWPALLPGHPETLVAEARTAEWVAGHTAVSAP